MVKKVFGEVDYQFVKKIEPILSFLYRYYFRCDISGWNHVPEKKAIYVGNHNGMLTFEVLMLFYAWWKRFGLSHRVLGVVHSVVFRSFFFRWLIPKLGTVPAEKGVSAHYLEEGYSLLIYPGGLEEAFRSYFQRKKIDFCQRKGFIRLALKSGVPLVPIVSIGAHESYFILHRAEFIVSWLGLKDKLRIKGVPITVRFIFFLGCFFCSFSYWFSALFLSIFIPMPAKMKFKILPPIDVCSFLDSSLDEEQNLQLIYDRVVELMQTELTIEYSKRRLPLVG